ncbi:MAG: glycosyltransferase family 4 protein [Candidatus Poseidoniaceae archaeon]|jgi:glycosyltransferase involved in cell wall biosynthesis|nr:glycosyltransferase family 4 protein [Candidatus Poseidoniaceae archaeon]
MDNVATDPAGVFQTSRLTVLPFGGSRNTSVRSSQSLKSSSTSQMLIEMHVALVSGEYPPRWGGIGSVSFHLAASLARRGHQVTVITRKNRGKRAPRQEGVNVIEVGWAPIPMQFTRSYGKKALKALKTLHRQQRVDVIHLLLPLISWTRKQYKTMIRDVAPIVSTLNGSWLGEREGMKLAAKHREAATWKNPNDLAILLSGGWFSRFERSGILESNLCVAISESTKSEFLSRYRPPVDWRCEVVRWGVDEKVLHPLDRDNEEMQLRHEETRKQYDSADEAALSAEPDTDTPLLLAVGRLVARKGYRLLLRTMPEILEKNPNAKLVIVGRGHMRKTLLKQAKNLGIEKSVYIESSLSFEELAQLYRSADLVIYPSYYEGQGLIPLEAMASGTAVVTVNNGPLPEMVDSSVGSLFILGDSKDLAVKVNDELANPQQRRVKGLAGRDKILDMYTYDHNATVYEKLYEEARVS